MAALDKACSPKGCRFTLTMVAPAKIRNVLLVLVGVAALLMKRHYAGPFVDIVHSYGGNVSASFAAYFVIKIATTGWKHEGLLTSGAALLVVELFEATNGFGVMTNVYDPADFAANSLGIGVALAIDTLAASTRCSGSDRRGRSAA